MPVHTKKQRLGQHFLINKGKLQKIVEALDLKSNDTIIEIGPGHGELTNELRIKNNELRIIAIEKDEKFVQCLQKKFAQNKNIQTIQGDALEILPRLTKKLKAKKYKIVGNIPFYITGYLLRILGDLENKPSLIVLTIQREVGERICTKPPRMNLLAASVQFWAEPEIIDYISKKDFQPIPEVDSAIIKLKTITLCLRSETKCYEYEKEYYKLIKILFKQPRKTILNNLKSLIKENQALIEKLKALEINPSDRPQNLTLNQIKKLTSLFVLSYPKPE